MIPDAGTFILAFIAAPAVVVILGYVAVRLHERGATRHPAK